MVTVEALAFVAQGRWGDHMWGWTGWWMGLAMVLFWVAVIWLVLILVRSTDQRTGSGRRPLDHARELLADRLARGEIDTDEYRERLDALP